MTPTDPDHTISDLQTLAERARIAYQWEAAAEYYRQALSLPDISPNDEYYLREGSAYCYQRLANFQAEYDDLEAMASIAQGIGDERLYLNAYTRQSFALVYIGEIKKSRTLADAAQRIAQNAGLTFYEAQAMYAIGLSLIESGDFEHAAEELHKAIQHFQSLGTLREEAMCAYHIAYAGTYTGQNADFFAQRVLEIARQLDDRLLEGCAYHILGIIHEGDPALEMKYYEQALEIYQAVGEVHGISAMTHKLGVFYLEFGLFKRAYTYFLQALQMDETVKSPTLHLLRLHLSAWAAFMAGDLEYADETNQRVIIEAREGGVKDIEAFAVTLQGWLLWKRGEMESAIDLIRTAAEQVEVAPAYLPFVLGWLGELYLEQGDLISGLHVTEKALEWTDDLHKPVYLEIPLWSHYQILKQTARTEEESEAAWDTLIRARDTLLNRIRDLADQGLRRSYLTNPIFHPEIILEWARQAHKRGESSTLFTKYINQTGNIQERLRRLLDIGTRLASHSDQENLLAFIMDEFIELSGAERAFIALETEGDMTSPELVLSHGLDAEQQAESYQLASSLIDQAILSQQTVFSNNIGTVPQGEPPEIHLRSVIVVPLIFHSRSIGVLYADVREIFGPFNREDADLLTLLANQTAAALENANWTHVLEQRVSDRTVELETINKISEALIASQDNSEILELVGKHIKQLFDAQNFFVSLAETSNDTIFIPYIVLNGKRKNPFSIPRDQGLTSVVIQQNAPILISSFSESQDYPGLLPEGLLEHPVEQISLLGVPLRRAEQVIGTLCIYELRDHVYHEAHLRLLSTIAANMGVALNNARLTSETQRLSNGMEERNAELAVINSVQEGLASKLDIDSIFELVGNRISEIFAGFAVSLYTYDIESDLAEAAFIMERGVQLYPPPFKPGPLGQWTIQHRKPLMISTQAEYEAIGAITLEGTEASKSGIYTPLVVNENVIGALNIESLDQEHAFTDSDLQLVTTIANSMSVALENARLFDEVQKRNREIQEALERQTATSDILRVMASSPMEIQPVLDAVAENAAHLCQANDVQIYKVDGDLLRQVSHFGPLSALQDGEPLPLVHGLITGRAVIEHRTIHIHDVANISSSEYPQSVKIQKRLGHRTIIVTPLLHEGVAIGAIVARRNTVHPFTEKQIKLLSIFADEAAIAIVNVRLFNQTTRLLKEMEQRNAELTIINSVQTALVSQLDFLNMIDVVGDKISEIFLNDKVRIGLLDREHGTIEIPYIAQNGKRFDKTELPLDWGLPSVVINTRQPLLINDDFEKRSLELGVVDVGETEQPKSWLGVPILMRDEVIGGIGLQNYQRENAYTESDVRLLQTLASSLGTALENARLFAETQRLLKETEQRATELAIINKVQEGLASKLEMHAIYDLVGDKIMEIFSADTTFIAFKDTDQNQLIIPYYADNGPKQSGNRPYGGGLAEHIINSGKPLLLNTEQEAEKYGGFRVPSPGSEKDLNQSFLGVPISLNGVTSGIVSVQSYKTYAYDQNDLRLLQTLANSMSVALENARLFDETQRLFQAEQQRSAELQIISAVSQALTQELDLQSLIDLVGDKLREVIHVDSIGIGLYDTSDELLHPAYVYKENQRIYAEPVRINPFSLRVAKQGKSLVINNNTERIWKRFGSNLTVGDEIPKSLVMVPILAGRTLIGGVTLQDFYQENAYSASAVRLLETLASNMGAAIQNARLFEETQRLLKATEQHATELATINRISQAIVAETDLDGLIQLIGEQIRQTFAADIVYVALLDQQTKIIHFPYTYGEEFDSLTLGAGLTSKIIETGEPLLINREMDKRRAELGTALVGKRARSYLGVPIQIGKNTFGVISVQSTKTEDLFSDGDLRILNTIAANIGTAIRNVSLFDEIKRQKQYYQAVIENSPAAIVLLDRNANVTGWNPAAEKLFGYTEEEALDHNIDDLIAQTETLHAEAIEYSQRVLTEKYIHRIVKRTRKDGSLLDVEVSALPVTVDGNQVDFIAIYHDITELQRARQAAEEANQAKSVFLANMSHELRTPLNAIIGFTRIVKRKGEDVLPEKQVDNLDKVLVSADHLLGLINSVLDISKIEAGRMEVVSESFDLVSLADQILSTTQPLVKETVELTSEIPPDLPQLHTDQDKLKQILLNLLSNAAKFTHQGQIILRAQSVDSMLVIEVQDSGIGISSEALGKIFEEFQQADTSTTREYGGTGLGLTISKRLAQLLGGDLTASSIEGEGSIFMLSIPLYCCENPSPEQLLPVSAEKYPQISNQPLILSIDDDPNIHDLLNENLSGHGYQVLGVLNGDDGLRLARQLKPIAITLDIMMPGKNGWQVLHELKSDPATSDIPVIMVTIMDKQAFGYQLGAIDYLVKPLKEDALLSAIQRIKSQNHTSSKLRLLVIDDDPNIPDIIREILVDTPYQIESALDGQTGLEAILHQPPDVILLDLMMPGINGFSLIESLNEKGLGVPIIVLTSMTLGTAELEILKGNVEQIIHKNGLEREKLLSKLQNTLEAVRLNMDEVRL